MVSRALDIVRDVQNANLLISSLYSGNTGALTMTTSERHCQTTLSDVEPLVQQQCVHSSFETGCLACTDIHLPTLIRVLNLPERKRVKLSLASQEEICAHQREISLTFLSRVEKYIDLMFNAACSGCNLNETSSKNVNEPFDDSSNRSAPLNFKSARYVYLPNELCVEQEGVYHGNLFVPSRNGKLLSWRSIPSNTPVLRTARVCCLLNWLSTPTPQEEHGRVIRQLRVLTKAYVSHTEGPLGLKCIRQSDLEEPGPITMLINFCV
uniref:Wsv267-like protein n=1 Tax=Metapenaeus ensis nimavirus TaxID=2133794 RepID=A0A401IP96_9VIRU|nr:MAG: wsv267-like protein [Metapenaeus ensis nimavirus]GBG35436.1 wsv267-like protein [Metapenaeus ensis nimavirus]